MRSIFKLGCLLVISTLTQPIFAGLAPLGGEYAMLGDVAGHQQRPCLVMGADGGFVVWQNAVAGVDGERVMIQRLNTDMIGEGGAVRVGLAVAGNEERPRVAMLADGGCVVVWESGPRASRNVHVRFVNADGTFNGGEIVANTFGAGIQEDPTVAVLSDGSAVVVWSSVGQDGSGAGVYGQRFTAAGVKVGGEFSVNQTTARNQMDPAVCAAGEGFVVGWMGETVNGTTGVGAPNIRGNVWGRVFDKDGNAVGNEYKMNGGDGLCSEPVLAAGVGGFVLAWVQQDEANLKNLSDIYARKFNAQGVPAGGESKINTYVTGRQESPAVGIMNDDILMTWNSGSMAGNGFEVHGRMMSGGSEFRVNTKVLYHQHQSTIAIDATGRAHVAWISVLQPRHSVIAAQLYSRGEGNGDVTAGPPITEFKNAQIVVTANTNDNINDPVGGKLEEMRVTAEYRRQQEIAAQQTEAAKLAIQASSKAAMTGVQSAARTQATLPSSGAVGSEASSMATQVPVRSGITSIPVGVRTIAGGVAKPAGSAVPANTTTASKNAMATVATQSSGIRPGTISAAATRVNAASLFTETRPGVAGTAAARATTQLAGRPTGSAATPVGSYITSRTVDSRAASQFSPQPIATARPQATVTAAARPMATAAERVNVSRSSTQMRTMVAQQSQVPVAARIVQNAGQFSMEWSGRQGMNYQVQGSADRVNWQNVGATRPSAGNDAVQLDSSTGQKFFRVIQAH